MIIQSVLLTDEHGQLVDFFAFGIAGKATQLVEPGTQGVERTARFDQMQPEFLAPAKKTASCPA